jgi:hypothetical protein
MPEGNELQLFCRQRAIEYRTSCKFLASKGWYKRFLLRFENYRRR